MRFLVCLLLSVSLHANCYQTFKAFLVDKDRPMSRVVVNYETYELFTSKGITYVYLGDKLQFRVETPLSRWVIKFLIESGKHIFKVVKEGDRIVVITSNEFTETKRFILRGVE